MTKEEMEEQGLLVIPDLNYGFAHYPYEIIRRPPAALREFLLEKIEANSWENSWVDFYYGELSPEEQDNVEALLETEQQEYIAGMDFYKGEVYFPLTPELFEITFLLYRKLRKSAKIVYNRLEIKDGITKERKWIRHDVVYVVFCFLV